MMDSMCRWAQNMTLRVALSSGFGISIPCNMHHPMAHPNERALDAILQHVILQLSTISPMAWRGRVRLTTGFVVDV